MSIQSLRKFRSGNLNSSSRIAQFKQQTRKEVPQPKKPGVLKNAWNFVTSNLIKPVSAVSNLLEDTGKTIGYGVAKLAGYKGNWNQAKQKVGIDFLGHQKDVWTGKNTRTYSDIMNEMAELD
jgi:hypothetical protein